MIASLEGKIAFRGEKYIIIEVNKIGYKIFVGELTLKELPSAGSNIKLFTYHYQHEDKMGRRDEIYGFLSLSELEFFEILNGISGVGPKSALGIISKGPIDNLKRAISAGDIHYLTKVSGIGQKKAERIILELKAKLGQGEGFGLAEDKEVIDALTALGYGIAEAREALKKLSDKVNIQDRNSKIKEALKILGSR
ncbi:MAG: Holliday junction DNA helicase RuvA [Candidatus Niyogibacteria bacterium RIFCSPLOWO2_12_FULL_41_13]|uniref:Holliday junction branch migration complex subunit RuvA n=1 Tax=Candidatus Niyogibacteria bacterium RIFCSPLOWO2_12_FULL_41_13 TaxID=1801726 RepID=A0A1G2F308_9BACT|nr:MAG: Holliday junction DNA helicase RuvA [Candidatus Niyogibacteria bacterium RIFCSPLOWO2_12_FULL_41_13]